MTTRLPDADAALRDFLATRPFPGLHSVGSARRVSSGPWSSVWRLATADGPVAVKRYEAPPEGLGWFGKHSFAAAEARALSVYATATPGRVPALVAFDEELQIVATTAVPAPWRRWADVRDAAHGRHVRVAAWLGVAVGGWHVTTADRDVERDGGADLPPAPPYWELAARLAPEHLPAVRAAAAAAAAPPHVLVHGALFAENVHIGPDGAGWVVDFGRSHRANPVLDVGGVVADVLIGRDVGWLDDAEADDVVEAFLDAYPLDLDVDVLRAVTGSVLLARLVGLRSVPASWQPQAAAALPVAEQLLSTGVSGPRWWAARG